MGFSILSRLCTCISHSLTAQLQLPPPVHACPLHDLLYPPLPKQTIYPPPYYCFSPSLFFPAPGLAPATHPTTTSKCPRILANPPQNVLLALRHVQTPRRQDRPRHGRQLGHRQIGRARVRTHIAQQPQNHHHRPA